MKSVRIVAEIAVDKTDYAYDLAKKMEQAYGAWFEEYQSNWRSPRPEIQVTVEQVS